MKMEVVDRVREMVDKAREEVVGEGTGLAMVAKGKGKKGRRY